MIQLISLIHRAAHQSVTGIDNVFLNRLRTCAYICIQYVSWILGCALKKKTICTYHLSLPPAQVIKESYDGGKDEH